MSKKRRSNRVTIGNARLKRKHKQKRMQHKGIRSAIGKVLGRKKAKKTLYAKKYRENLKHLKDYDGNLWKSGFKSDEQIWKER